MRVRAAPPLLALALCAVLVGAAPAPPPPPAPAAPSPPALPPRARGLLVLRAACHELHAAIYDPFRLQKFAAAFNHDDLLDKYRFLSYEETCDASWVSSVAVSALRALGAGARVVSAGWPGARTCLLARGAVGSLPAACARPTTRARLLAELAARLRWRRALLAGAGTRAPLTDECAATLRAARLALLAGGVRVLRAAPTAEQLSRYRPHVVIACASQTVFLPIKSAFTAFILLQFETANYASSMSNITLVVEESPYVPNVDTFKFTNGNLPQNVANSSNANLIKFKDSLSRLSNDTVFPNNYVHKLNESNNDMASVTNKYNVRQAENKKRTNMAPRLVLSDERLGPREPPPPAALYRRLLDALDASRDEPAHHVYYLYENTLESWQLFAVFNTVSTYILEEHDWETEIKTLNTTASWDRLQAKEESLDEVNSGVVVWSIVAALAVVCAAAGAWAVARGGRGRGNVVLAPGEFSFPADEARRVPDGMETMLSCWLQQLHEFGGPELEPPDLLAPAPPAPSASAPSSTASHSRLAIDKRTRYKGDAVQLKALPIPAGATEIELRRKATDVLLLLHTLRHENLNPFIGCLCEVRPSLVWEHCGRGSLEDVLRADEIKLDWTFRLSLLTDAVRGLRYLHASPLRVHGRLSSRNCVVDSRWVLRLADYGLPDFYRAQGLTPPARQPRDRLWTAPELLRAGRDAAGTQPGDVYSFAIIMQEVIVRGEPYCMLALSPEEIVEKLCRPPPLIRPSVSMSAAPPEAVSVMRQCWAEAPDLRPDTAALHDIFRLLHRGRKINIVDSMFEMLEKYSNNLEELIKERTDQLDMEKKKTEQLLNRMLPRSVAEQLVLGLRVEPEEFEEVTVYFSDIVGFTELAARSSPVQVVALLNDLYTTFDDAIQRYSVYKVETIGDAYMVVGGAPARARDHAESVATMALHLLHLAGRFRIRHLPATPLHLRIGLHSGPCCAGVVGLTMPRYCLFGDTVNTASRMESTGAAWRIQVSGATAARLEAAGGYRLRSRGLTQIKGKGAMHTYWLLGKDGFDKPLPTPPPLPTEEALIEHEHEHVAGDGAGDIAGDVLSPGARSVTGDAPHQDKYAWTRSGAVSADSSPPAQPYSRYRCIGGGARPLRRQWSLERGEALAAARAHSPERPLALAAPAPRAPPRYRMRPDPNHRIPTSTSFD